MYADRCISFINVFAFIWSILSKGKYWKLISVSWIYCILFHKSKHIFLGKTFNLFFKDNYLQCELKCVKNPSVTVKLNCQLVWLGSHLKCQYSIPLGMAGGSHRHDSEVCKCSIPLPLWLCSLPCFLAIMNYAALLHPPYPFAMMSLPWRQLTMDWTQIIKLWWNF